MTANLRTAILIIFTAILVLPRYIAGQNKATDADPLRATVGAIKETLVQHYKPRLPPEATARFVPIQFDSCELKWELVSVSGPFKYTTRQSVNLADLDPTPPLVLMEQMPRTDRWFFELRTVNEEPKVKGEWLITEGPKVRDRKEVAGSRTGFGADSQELAQHLADDFVSLIKQCSQRRAQQIVGREPR